LRFYFHQSLNEEIMKARAFRPMMVACLALVGAILLPAMAADAATIVALGASNTAGKGVSSDEAYPAQLQAILRARGSGVTVVNAGISGDTTEGMLGRLDQAVPNGTSAVILQPGGNDRRKGSVDRTAEIQSRLSARHIPVVIMANSMFRGLPHQPDGEHLTPQGYHMLAAAIAPRVAGFARR
jgi:acyl-CoA thioesterase I